MSQKIFGFLISLTGVLLVLVEIFWTTGESRYLPHLPLHLATALVFLLGLTGLILVYTEVCMMMKSVSAAVDAEGDKTHDEEVSYDRS